MIYQLSPPTGIRPSGAMDSALDFESRGCGFESHLGLGETVEFASCIYRNNITFCNLSIDVKEKTKRTLVQMNSLNPFEKFVHFSMAQVVESVVVL
jgi:hypothetical protein